STDRSVVAALLSTTPRPVTKSSANDLAPQHCPWLFLLWYRRLCSETARIPFTGASQATLRLRSLASQHWECEVIVAITRRDSDLEAFSRNPSDGSFAPLAFQPST